MILYNSSHDAKDPHNHNKQLQHIINKNMKKNLTFYVWIAGNIQFIQIMIIANILQTTKDKIYLNLYLSSVIVYLIGMQSV